jgi:hypothetical protein
MMRLKMLTAAAITLLSLSSDLWSRTEFFRLDDLKPGMKGVGRTVFQGTTPEEFQVEILGLMRGIGPGTNAVLARFSGGPLAHTGVFEGMSGTPVFIDGKLLGAVAFSFEFSKEAIGGITPITQMVDAFAGGGAAAESGPRIQLKKSMLWDYMLAPPEAAGRSNLLARVPLDLHPQQFMARFGGHSLVPIATPLSLGGFAPEVVEAFVPQFRAMGLSILQGAGASAAPQAVSATKTPVPSDSAAIEPGSNISIPLVRGDLDASAGGTVTYIDGDRLYAFGHLLFSLGFTELPMHKARAITVFPSLQSSFKILETLDPVGTIRQDRASGIYGVLGQNARMIPMTVRMNTSRGVKKELHYELARDQFLTPFLVNLTIFNSILSSERALGFSTLAVKGKILIKGEKPIEIENRFSSESDSPVYASLSIALPVNFLLAFGYKNLEFEKMDVDITASEDDRAAILDSIRIDRNEVSAGDAVDLQIVARKANGEIVEESYPVRIPPNVTPGPISLLVADGMNLMAADAREQGDDLIPRDLTQMIEFINNLRKNSRLYARLYRREAGAVVRGEGLPGLPPSILSILRSDRSSGGMSPIQTSAFMEYELPPSDYVISGARTLNIKIKP